MVERKTPARPKVVKAAEAAEPVGRFYELQREVNVPEPYVLTEDITIQPITRARNRALGQATTEEEAERAMFGDAYDAVVALYADRPDAEYMAFAVDVRRHMFGQAIEEAPGKSEESSNS